MTSVITKHWECCGRLQSKQCTEATSVPPSESLHPMVLLGGGARMQSKQHKESLPKGNGKESYLDEQNTETRQHICL